MTSITYWRGPARVRALIAYVLYTYALPLSSSDIRLMALNYHVLTNIRSSNAVFFGFVHI